MTIERMFPPRAADCTSTRPQIARRGVLCVLAGAVPAAVLDAAERPAAAAVVPDPIFAAIARHHKAAKAFTSVALPDDEFNRLSDIADDLAKELLLVEPTSFGGVAALLAYYANRMIEDDCFFPDDHVFTEEEGGCHCYGVKIAQLAARSVAKIAARADYARYHAAVAI